MLKSILKTINPAISKHSLTICEYLNTALLTGRNTQSTPYIIQSMGQDEFFVGLNALLKTKLVTSSVAKNFAELTINTRLIEAMGYDLEELVFSYKLQKYSLVLGDSDLHVPRVRQGKQLNAIGNVSHANVLNEAHMHNFSFDVSMLSKYIKPIAKKLLEKVIKKKGAGYVFESSYEDVIIKVLQQYAFSDEEYSLGGCNFDQRYRAISLQLEKILNPIGFTIGRALLKLTPRLLLSTDKDSLDDLFLFIAQETVGACIGSTIEEKIQIGKASYANNVVPTDIVGKIWIERIYRDLGILHVNGSIMWNIPIEIDYSMSAMMVTGCVLNYAPYIRSCNGFSNVVQQDPWDIINVHIRDLGKLLIANIYGSNESIKSLAKGMFTDVDPKSLNKQIRAVEVAKDSGKFSIMLALKDLLKMGSDIKSDSYMVNVESDSYEVKIQKRKPVDSKTTQYFTLLAPNTPYVFSNTEVISVVDSEQHRNYFYTGLIHSLDPQFLSASIDELVLETAIDKVDRPCIPVHDAIILLPHDARIAREGSRKHIIKTIKNGDKILMDYMESIGAFERGIPTNVQAMKLYDRLQLLLSENSEPIDLDLITGYCMK